MQRLVSVLLMVLAVACGTSTPGTPTATLSPRSEPVKLWPLPDDPMGLARKAGLEPERSETLEYHVHAHLDVFKDGRPVLVPGGIGIDVTAAEVKKFDEPTGAAYGGIDEPCAKPCISPLHTHGADGVIHTESPTPTPNTFGEFLIEWNVTLPEGTKTFVDGKEYTGDVAKIELSDRKQIAIVMGTPPDVIPSTFPAGAG